MLYTDSKSISKLASIKLSIPDKPKESQNSYIIAEKEKNERRPIPAAASAERNPD